jgi:hypothetical protein
MRRVAVRLLLTGILVALLLATIDLEQLQAVLVGADLVWLGWGMLLAVLSILCAAWRWHILLAVADLPFRVTARVTIISTFFSLFLPSSIGGDVMKVVLLTPAVGEHEHLISSVLVDRLVGLGATVVVGLVAALLLPDVWGNSGLIVALAGIALGFGLAVGFLLSRRLTDRLGRMVPGFLARRFGAKTASVREAIYAFRQRPTLLWYAAALSLLRQLLICALAYCAGIAFHLSLGIEAYLAIIPLSVAITTLPLSINGIGLQDNALVLLFGLLGVNAVQSLSVSLFLHAQSNLIGLVGGVLWVLLRHPEGTSAATPPHLVKS